MVALVNGDLLTAARTAACSALSIRHLARPGSRVLAVLGNGPRAREHARYACRVHHFTAVRIGARDPAKAAALAANLEGEGLPARGTTIDDAIAGAHVVCAATSTVEPLLRGGNVRPGTHILREALVVVEHRETCLQPFPAGSNDLAELVAAGELDPDGVVAIGELVDGRRPGREDEDRVTVFKSVGVAVQDAAAASVVLAAARRDGRGIDVSL